jgi:serine/threonine protein kinase
MNNLNNINNLFNISLKNKTLNYKKRNFTKKNNVLNGGRFIGEGGYGCVLQPELSCGRTKKTTQMKKRLSIIHKKKAIYNDNKEDKEDKEEDHENKLVSKIIIYPDEYTRDELTVSKKLKKIDSINKYFITYKKLCKFTNIPIDRKDSIKVKYTDDTLLKYRYLESKKLDKIYCPIDLSLNPINLIMPYGGYDLIKIINNDDKSEDFIKTRSLLLKNIKDWFKHLLTGLYKMHSNNIVNNDIKEENIMSYFNKNTGKLEVKFIDFGLSDIITPSFCKLDNINIKGTEIFISPEQYVSFYIYDYDGYSNKYIIRKIIEECGEYMKEIPKYIGEKELVKNIDKSLESLYMKIVDEFDNNTIISKYFGKRDKLNGYLQKGDIYALGLTIYEFLFDCDIDVKENEKLHDLLLHMIVFNPEDRFNVVECLEHKYFS